MKYLVKLFSAAVVLSLVAVSCKKDDDSPNNGSNTDDKATVKLHFHHQFGDQAFALDTEFMHQDTLIQFTRAKFYVSGIYFAGHMGDTSLYLEDVFLLIDGSSHVDHELGDFDPIHLHMMGFNVGLDSATNHQDPTMAPAPLNDATMHWGWNPAAGYKFLVLEGKFDTDNDGDLDGDDADFQYHVATDELLRNVTVGGVHTDLEAGETTTIEIDIDYAALLEGINIRATPMGHGNTTETVAIADNAVSSTFTIE